MSTLDLEGKQLEQIHLIALMIQLAAAGIATSFMLILVPNIETISLTAFYLGFTFKRKFALQTTVIMVIGWELLATLVFSTSGIIFFFKLIAWIFIALMGYLASSFHVSKPEYFMIFGVISALIFDLLVTIPYAILNATSISTFYSLFLSSVVIGLFFSSMHIIGNLFLFALFPLLFDTLDHLLSMKFGSIKRNHKGLSKVSRNRILLLFMVIILLFLLFSQLFSPSPPNSYEVYPITSTITVSYAGLIENNSLTVQAFTNNTVYDILIANFVVETISYGHAIYISGINNVIANQNITNYFWIYYVNGIRVNQACNAYYLNDHDSIIWSYEK
ncbi:MAG: DUF4430 domain-containing protein [Candidatus Heimdallarchaeota archaeon]|nr:DUF4430 domain-containing protein [Candidatus Heimdallarchaeota archaeon]